MNAIMPKDFTIMNVQELAKFTKEQEIRYKQLKINGDDFIDDEKIYVNARKLFFEKLDLQKKEKSSENVYDMMQEEDPVLPKKETPIHKLNLLLRNQGEHELGTVGGISDGGCLAQIIAPSGVGKSTLAMAISVGFSATHKTAWLDYERGKIDYKRELKSFIARTKNPYNLKNMDYLDGFKASDELDFIVEEITLLAYTGVKDFIIDSFMAIMVDGENDSASWAKKVSLRLMGLAKELGVNIWVINQISAKDEEIGRRQPIYGHASRYASDYMFFIQKIPKLGQDGRPMKDDVGQPVYEKDKRLFTCDKNRYDKHWGEGSIEIYESDLFGEAGFEIEYDENQDTSSVYIPQI